MFASKEESPYYQKHARIFELIYWVGLLAIIGSTLEETHDLVGYILAGASSLILLLTLVMRQTLYHKERGYISYKERYRNIADSLRRLNSEYKLIDIIKKDIPDNLSEDIIIFEETLNDKGNANDWSFRNHA